MPAPSSCPIPAVLAKLGPLDERRVADLRPYLQSVPDPRARRGRWYSLTSILLVCAGAAVAGSRSVEELAEWGARASRDLLETLGVRRHLLGWRRAPSAPTIGRILAALDADALDRAVGIYLADRHRATPRPDPGTGGEKTTLTAPAPAPAPAPRLAIAVDGKALKGSARLEAPHRHLLSAVTHYPMVALAQAEVGTKTNETGHFRSLLAPLDLAGALVTFDALHSVKAQVTWLVETKAAHYIAVIKTNQPTAYRQLDALPWKDIAVQHTTSATGHGRHESRSIKTCGIADNLGGIAFPHARLAIRVHRRRQATGERQSRENVYAVTSLDAHQTTPAALATAMRGHWAVETSSHHIRHVTFAEDASTVHTGSAPRAMATFRNLTIGVLKVLGADNIAKTTRAIRDEPERSPPILGITYTPDLHGT